MTRDFIAIRYIAYAPGIIAKLWLLFYLCEVNITSPESSESELTQPEVLQNPITDEDDGFKHYALKHKITEAYVMGTPVTALCGKTWVPSKLPDNFPMCVICGEIYDFLAQCET